MKVNGKEYTMWGQLVERADEFIGWTLDDYDMGMHASTIVTGITLKPNGCRFCILSNPRRGIWWLRWGSRRLSHISRLCGT